MAKESTAPEQNMTVALDHKQVADMQSASARMLAQAQSFTIETIEDYEGSAPLLNVIAERQRKIEEFFEEPARQANSLHKFITGLRSTLLINLKQAESLIKNRRATWRAEEERKRQIREQEERDKAKKEQEAQALQQAKELSDQGEHEAAEMVIDRAVNAPPPPVMVPSTVPKQAGIPIRKIWKYRIKNPDLIKKEFLVPDESKMQAIVTRLGHDAVPIIGPGSIECYQEEVESVRRKP